MASYREAVETEETRLRQRKLDALGEFAGGAGHELNNPLAVIFGRAQLLLARTKDSETIRSLRIILNQAGRAHRILRDLMFVARAPSPRRRACRPSELLGSCLRDFQAECAERGVRLFSEVDDSLPATWADPEALRHLAEILLRNALQATPAGGQILVRATAQGDELLWSFSDTGKGIGDEEAVHLFDPFYCGRQAGRGAGTRSAAGRPDRRTCRRPVAMDLKPSPRDRLSGASPRHRRHPTRRPITIAPRVNLRFRKACARSRVRQSLRHDHLISDVMAIDTEKGDIERFGVIPVMTLEATVPPAPGAGPRPLDQTEPLGQ